MEALSVRDYRNNLSATFDRADRGETVLVRRKNRLYAVTSIGTEDLTITPALRRRIAEARKEHREGKGVVCRTMEELDAHLNSL